jgi:hypothetical protein
MIYVVIHAELLIQIIYVLQQSEVYDLIIFDVETIY